jgi:hypothetical protein
MSKNIFGMGLGDTISKIEKVKKPTPFDFAKAICTKNKEDIEKVEQYIDTSTYSQYMLINIFSQTIYWKEGDKWMSSETWRFVKELNVMNITNRMQFDMLMNLVPKNPGMLGYKYKKFTEKNKEKIALKWKFNEKDEIINQYLNLISDDELNDIMKEKKYWDKLHKTKKRK